ncbi:DUF3667 domain-containing protein [Aliikangiella marina]|uniref:DUF3667 domain-containing protein n=1 Tax=Aliikangiella marina TaxID=1712262 RepID=A0A545TH03_9GAMM|nr:DUF3667 domain-containing protein [Aliikangiella marina]TQV76509.1 DUF3667 domain-containing protein [Aliikangiella marina]
MLSLKLLVTKPGQLAQDYLNGIRVHRINPFQLFLIINVIYFVFIVFVPQNAFTTPLEVHLNATNFPHHALANDMVAQALSEQNLSKTTYAQKFDQLIQVHSKSLVILLIPMVALISLPLLKECSHKMIASVVFASHFVSALLLFMIVFGSLLYALGGVVDWLGVPHIKAIVFSEAFGSIVMVGFCLSYFASSLRRINGIRWPRAIGLATFLVFAFYWIILIYRMILFFTTFYSL